MTEGFYVKEGILYPAVLDFKLTRNSSPMNLSPTGFRVGESHEYAWGNGNRDECELLCGSGVAADIYDGPLPKVESYTVRVISSEPPAEPRNRVERRAHKSRARRNLPNPNPDKSP